GSNERPSGAHHSRSLATCRRGCIWISAGGSPRDRWPDASSCGCHCLENARTAIFYQPPTLVCRANFNRRVGGWLRLLANCCVAFACYQLGQPALAAGNLVAHYRAPVSCVPLVYAKRDRNAVCGILQNGVARIRARWLPLAVALAFVGFATAYKTDRTSFWFL